MSFKWYSTLCVFATVFVSQCYCQSLGTNLLRQFLRRNSALKDEQPQCIHDLPIRTINFDNENGFLNCFQQSLKLRSLSHPDQYDRVDDVIVKYGYTLSTYNNLQTKDGYLLKVFRISGSPKSPPRFGKPVALLVHGMGAVSDVWVIQSGGRNLAFKLADSGYDVWLPNFRGSDMSRGHVKFDANVDIEAYWDFSFHEMGIYDLPKILELVQNKTEQEKIFYICHSAGCAAYAVMLSEMPEMNDKFEASFHMAPALYVGHSYSPYRTVTAMLELGPVIQRIINALFRGRIEVGNRISLLQSQLCAPTAIRCGVCENMLFYMYGYDAPQINITDVPNIVSKISNAISIKTLQHYGENWKTCMFRKRDYGYTKNVKFYGQSQPPPYNLSRLTAPMYVYYGDADNFVPPEDVKITKWAIPEDTVKGFFRVKWRLFNHLDFLIAKDADIYVYNSILEILQSYTKSNLNEIPQ